MKKEKGDFWWDFLTGVIAVVSFSLFVGVCYAAIHFISKYW